MELIYIKFFMSLCILAAGLIGGLIPVFAVKDTETSRFLTLSDAFACGVFLGAGLIHLLPESQRLFASIYPRAYPYMPALSVTTVIVMLLIEQGFTKILHIDGQARSRWLAYLLALMLSIHSIVAGTALGIESTFATLLLLFIAIIAHKSTAAFALGVYLRKANIVQNPLFVIVVGFALMTPLGALLGAILGQHLQQNPAKIAEAVFNAIAAGTFIYIAAFCHTSIKNAEISVPRYAKVGLFILGLLIMAIIALWL